MHGDPAFLQLMNGFGPYEYLTTNKVFLYLSLHFSRCSIWRLPGAADRGRMYIAEVQRKGGAEISSSLYQSTDTDTGSGRSGPTC